MASHPTSSYEPYRHVGDEDPEHSEELLAPGPDERSDERPHVAPREVYLNKPGTPRKSHVRTALRALALLIAVSVLAVQAYAIFTWMDTRHDTYRNPKTGFRTRSWATLDSWPTFWMLGVGAFASLVELLALTSLCSCFRGLHDGVLHAISVYLSSIAVIAAWIAGIVAFRVVFSHGKNKDHWDIWSWTCYRGASSKDIPWKAICVQQNYTFAASILAVVIELLCVVLFIFRHRELKNTINYGKARSSVKMFNPGRNWNYRAAGRS